MTHVVEYTLKQSNKLFLSLNNCTMNVNKDQNKFGYLTKLKKIGAISPNQSNVV